MVVRRSSLRFAVIHERMQITCCRTCLRLSGIAILEYLKGYRLQHSWSLYTLFLQTRLSLHLSHLTYYIYILSFISLILYTCIFSPFLLIEIILSYVRNSRIGNALSLLFFKSRSCFCPKWKQRRIIASNDLVCASKSSDSHDALHVSSLLRFYLRHEIQLITT